MHINIAQRDIEVMFCSRKRLLHYNGIPWFKKGNGFDVPMAACDGAEICELTLVYLCCH